MLPKWEKIGLSIENCQKIRSFVLNNWMPSEAYKMKEGASPFLQGYEERDGWVKVEFWGNNEERIANYKNALDKLIT